MQQFTDSTYHRDARTVHERGLVDGVTTNSIRYPTHATESVLAGVDVVTVLPDVAESTFDHPKTDQGLASFHGDWGNEGSPVLEND